MRLLLITLLLFSTSAESFFPGWTQAKWTKIYPRQGVQAEFGLYLDELVFKDKEGVIRLVRLLHDFEKTVVIEGKKGQVPLGQIASDGKLPYRSPIGMFEFQCKERLWRRAFASYHSEPMGTGTIVGVTGQAALIKAWGDVEIAAGRREPVTILMLSDGSSEWSKPIVRHSLLASVLQHICALP